MNLNKRNYPPESGIRLPAAEMRTLTLRLFEAVGMGREDAAVLAKILNINDRRCLFSHGTGQVPYYLQKIKDGDVNPRPKISVVSEDMGGHMIPFDEELFKRLPMSYFKAMGLTAAIRSLGGVFAGIYKEGYWDSTWESNQGSFIAVVNVAHFMPLDDLKQEMDRFIGDARATRPLPGMERAELAGGNEWTWDRENALKGIPIGDAHRQALQEEADKLGIETPFARFEETRF